MATGVEIAGLVLGSIPLVISALENYENLLDPTKAFLKYRGQLSRATRELVNQYTSYEQSMQILLSPITDPQELLDMMENANSELWRDKEIEAALRKKLGRSYPACMRTIRDIESTMKAIAGNLNIEGADRITHDGLEAIVAANPPQIEVGRLPRFEFRERIKFTMKRQSIRRCLDDLTKAITQLDTYLEKAEKLEEPYNARSKSKFALPLRVMQQNAGRLFDVLTRTWCSNHSKHSAGILLEQRLATQKKRGTSDWQQKGDLEKYDSHRFGISLLQTPSPRKWLEAEFHIVEPDIATTKLSRSTVKIVISSATTTTHTPATALPYRDPSQLPVVRNLCTVIQQPCHPCIGFYIDEDGCVRGAYPAKAHSTTDVDEGVSLGEILANRPGPLSKQEIYSLSITLASSLLQLNQTPWLQRSWNKTDIMFFRAKESSAAAVDIRYPYLTCEHHHNPPPDGQNIASPGDDCSKILSLGVLLLEISCGQPIEKLRQADDLGPDNKPNELSDLNTVRRWLMTQKNKGDISFAFYSAISHCLKCYVDPASNLEDMEFARNIEEQILAPLENEQNVLLLGPSLSVTHLQHLANS
ncbi:hypothetical protein D8B26_008293 [Coccidioides posadasii str. Silveira]|uniref:DUF7580 domain-containing protein n=2 Tax=Coccidioides posadasii TaxID=199306 RepID=E9DGS9_COCPS|nr:hypothetical protein CPC735_044070 [Coccidioides posadasii C735 delta SOWgp]EER25963.1 hypothetical protein CPC735_044070 [Coccidioides posadasii C735 delta SOWgp]EFW14439.1 conserved hypothetical protein [Coccidioides posadasii str. Silveira]QVM13687.1 hypothetical protein D8B26_008293 [Coccidioides posadasii str. Silveira]|eukprot:XP_003068108.1 hypothetical protein CPC735_044070 [Coccidioides posadasii C735 delta SOWgp]